MPQFKICFWNISFQINGEFLFEYLQQPVWSERTSDSYFGPRRSWLLQNISFSALNLCFRKNDDPLSSPSRRSRYNNSNNWLQCRNCFVQKFKISSVGSRRTDFNQTLLGEKPFTTPFKTVLKRCYYSNTDAIIYVVDSVDKERIGISKNEMVSMLEEEELKKGIFSY